MKPQVFHIKTGKQLKEITNKLKPIKKFDLFEDLLREHYLNINTKYYFSSKTKQELAFNIYLQSLCKDKSTDTLGEWVYLPWNGFFYHLLDRKKYYELRTLRNRELITTQEQKILHKKSISIAGLSVGKNTLISLIRSGIGNTYNLADNDTFEISNINRAMYDLLNYRQPKLESTSQDSYQIDPFLKITPFIDGINNKNIDQFTHNTDLIIDTFDSFPLKLELRRLAKLKKIPVLSGVDLENGCLLIIERYDSEPKLNSNLFLNNLDPKNLDKKNITKTDITKFFINMIGQELHSPTMLNSVNKVGTELTSYPQLIIASQLLASCITLATKKILLRQPLPSQRIHIDLDSFI